MKENIHWLGHASFKIKASRIIYIDPWKLKDSEPADESADEPADIIMITHDHYDHLSEPDVEKIRTPNTTIVTTADCAAKLKGNVKTIKAGESLTVDGVEIEAVPAYNVDKQFHPKENGWVGFILNIDNTRIYHTGDTDCIPEMEGINADIVLIPVGGTYTMTAEEAAGIVNKFNPSLAIPMHWGDIVGSKGDAETFKRLCNVPVEILKIDN